MGSLGLTKVQYAYWEWIYLWVYRLAINWGTRRRISPGVDPVLEIIMSQHYSVATSNSNINYRHFKICKNS